MTIWLTTINIFIVTFIEKTHEDTLPWLAYPITHFSGHVESIWPQSSKEKPQHAFETLPKKNIFYICNKKKYKKLSITTIYKQVAETRCG